MNKQNSSDTPFKRERLKVFKRLSNETRYTPYDKDRERDRRLSVEHICGIEKIRYGVKSPELQKDINPELQKCKVNVKQVIVYVLCVFLFLDLLKYNWVLYRLSPLYNVNYRQVKLKQYAFRITQALSRSVTNNHFNSSFKTSVTVISEANEEDKSLEVRIYKVRNV